MTEHDVPTPHQALPSVIVRSPFPDASWNSLAIAILYGIFGWSMLFQSTRWTLTPAYGNLFHVLPEMVWGLIYVATSALLFAGGFLLHHFGRRGVIVVALAVAVVLTSAWLAAFLVRWLTSPATTPETWGSFAIFLVVLLRAPHRLDKDMLRVTSAEK